MDIFCKNVHGRVVIRYLAFIIRNLKIFCVIFLKKMVVRVAVLPRVDQLTKVMPNFWSAVYSTTVCNWSLDMTPIPLKVFWAKLKEWILFQYSILRHKCNDVVYVRVLTKQLPYIFVRCDETANRDHSILISYVLLCIQMNRSANKILELFQMECVHIWMTGNSKR